MKSHFLLLYLLSLSLVAQADQEFLMWRKVDDVVAPSQYYSNDASLSTINVDAAVPYQTVVRIVNDTPFVLKLHCLVNALKPTKKIRLANLCIGKTCESVIGKSIVTLGNHLFNVVFDNSSGVIVSMEYANQPKDLSGLFWCDLGNDNGRILSSTLEIMDLNFKVKAFANQREQMRVKTLQEINVSSIPMTLECPNTFANPEDSANLSFAVKPRFDWALCNADRADTSTGQSIKCHKEIMHGNKIDINLIFPETVVHVNGSLTIFDINSEKFNSYILICYDKTRLNIHYGIYGGPGSTIDTLKPLSVDGTQHLFEPISAISAKESTHYIREGPRAESYLLLAMFKGKLSTVVSTWYHNDKKVQGLAKYKFDLGNNITHDAAGLYRLEVQGTIILTFFFKVVVLSPPQIATSALSALSSNSEINYVVPEKPVHISLTCPNANKAVLLLNGEVVKSDSEEEMKQSWKLLTEKYHLNGLTLDWKPLPFQGEVVTYNSTIFATIGSHMISVEFNNSVGLTRYHTLVNVVPKPELENTPSESPCATSCVIDGHYSFLCKVDDTVAKKIESKGASINIEWLLNSDVINDVKPESEEDLQKFFQVVNLTQLDYNAQNKFSEMTPLFKKQLQNANLSCHVRVLNPKLVPLYNSNDDPELQNKTSFRLKMQDRVKEGSIMDNKWLWISVGGVLILLFVSLLLVVCMRPEKGSATYLVDEIERKQGNDPDKEIEEHELFRAYNRDNEDPLAEEDYVSFNSLEQNSGADDENKVIP